MCMTDNQIKSASEEIAKTPSLRIGIHSEKERVCLAPGFNSRKGPLALTTMPSMSSAAWERVVRDDVAFESVELLAGLEKMLAPHRMLHMRVQGRQISKAPPAVLATKWLGVCYICSVRRVVPITKGKGLQAPRY